MREGSATQICHRGRFLSSRKQIAYPNRIANGANGHRSIQLEFYGRGFHLPGKPVNQQSVILQPLASARRALMRSTALPRHSSPTEPAVKSPPRR